MRQRLDQMLAERGLVASRSRARDLIKRGLVQIDGATAEKASQAVTGAETVEVAASVADDVSRGAEKLRGALAAFQYEVCGRVCVDVGASAGGFTQVLLSADARHVYAVDVGHGQLSRALAGDPRVSDYAATDARTVTREMFDQPITAIVCDVSFISLTKALPTVLELAAPDAWCIALIKPQFEAGRDAIGRGGVVRESAARIAVRDSVASWFATQPGWQVDRVVPSPITGGDGNAEWLLGARKSLRATDD